MEKEELFVIKWDEFRSNVSANISDLRFNTEFQDVTLYIDKDHTISAHKVILSACSTYFHSLLGSLPATSNPHPIILMPQGLKHAELVYLLDYIYHGEVSLPESHLERFMKIAERFQVRGLNKNNVTKAPHRTSKPPDSQRPRRPSQPMKSVGLLCPHCSIMCKDVAALKLHFHDCPSRIIQSNDQRPIGSVAPHTRRSAGPSGGKVHHKVPAKKVVSGGISRPQRVDCPQPRPSPVAPPADKKRKPDQDIASNLSQRFGGGISVSSVSSQSKAKVEEEPSIADTVKEEPEEYYTEEDKDFVAGGGDEDLEDDEDYYDEEEDMDGAAYMEEGGPNPGYPGYDYYGQDVQE